MSPEELIIFNERKAHFSGKLIDYIGVMAAISTGVVTNLGKQTFFKNEDGTPASLINFAEKNKDIRLIKLLLSHRILPNITNQLLKRSLFLWFMESEDLNQDINLILQLIKDGRNLNCQDRNNKALYELTSLSRAIRNGTIHVAKFLIEDGGNINPPCVIINYCVGSSPLSLEMKKNYDKLVDSLLKNGIDINQQSNSQGTAFHYACWYNDAKVFQCFLDDLEKYNGEVLMILLMNYGINLSVLNLLYEMSIGHDAVSSNALNCIKHVLDMNPDINLVDEENKLVIDYLDANSLEIGKILKRHIVRLYAAGFYLHERNLETISGEDYAHFYAECCQQVDEMKKTGISSTSHVNVYDSLFMTKKKLILCLESADNPGILESGFYKKFPLYGGMIVCIYKKAYQYIVLREIIRTSVYILFNNYLPTTIIEEIFSYFSFNDLVELRKNWETKDSRTSDEN